jgi:phytoene dehydrogenase-like protein
MEEFEVIVVGGGHNGLTAAAYLAKAGLKVLLLEGKDYVGGGRGDPRGHAARLPP